MSAARWVIELANDKGRSTWFLGVDGLPTASASHAQRFEYREEPNAFCAMLDAMAMSPTTNWRIAQ